MQAHTLQLLNIATDFAHRLRNNTLDWLAHTPVAGVMVNRNILLNIYDNIINEINNNSETFDKLLPGDFREYSKSNKGYISSFPLTNYNQKSDKSQRTYIVYRNKDDANLNIYCLTQKKFPDGHKIYNDGLNGKFKKCKPCLQIDVFPFTIMALITPLKNSCNQNDIAKFNK